MKRMHSLDLFAQGEIDLTTNRFFLDRNLEPGFYFITVQISVPESDGEYSFYTSAFKLEKAPVVDGQTIAGYASINISPDFSLDIPHDWGDDIGYNNTLEVVIHGSGPITDYISETSVCKVYKLY